MVSDKIKSLIKEVEAIKQRLKYNPNNGNISYELRQKQAELKQAIAEAKEDSTRMTEQKMKTRMGMRSLSDNEKFTKLKKETEEKFKAEIERQKELAESMSEPKPVVPEQPTKKSRWSKIADSDLTWRAGRAAKSGARSAAYAVGDGLSYMKDKTLAGGRKVKDAASWLKDKASNIDPNNRLKYELLLALAIAVHLIDAFAFRFSIANSQIIFSRFMLYFFLVLATHLVLKEYSFTNSLLVYGKVAAIPALGIPFVSLLLGLFTLPLVAVENISAFTLAVPFYLLYLREYKGIKFPMGNKPIKFIGNLLFTPSGWALIWYIFLVWMIMSALIMTASTTAADAISGIPGAENTGFDPITSVEGLTTWAYDTYQRTINTIQGIGSGIQGEYDRLYNDTLGGYYTGQVEENKELTGVFITEFRAQGNYYEGIPISIYGIIKARSFVEDFTMTTNCSAENIRNKSIIIQGTTNPSEFRVYREDQRGVICEFPTGLPPGDYRVSLNAYFNFQTWAYTMYTFMDRTLITSIRVGGEDVNQKFNIPKKPKTIYTNGPIKLGMNEELDMPIGLTTPGTEVLGMDPDTRVPVGITIDDRVPQLGSKGTIQKVNSLQLRLPEEIEIEKCTLDITGKATDTFSRDYVVYTFDNKRIDLQRTYMTVGCFLKISPSNAATLLRDRGGKAQVSVVGTADYAYTLSRETPLKILPDPSKV